MALWLVAVTAIAPAAWCASRGAGSELLLRLSPRESAIAWSSETAKVASAAGRRLRIWDLQTARLQREFLHPRGEVGSLLLSPDGSTVASVQDRRRGGRVRLWDQRTGRAVRTLTFPECEGMEAGLFAVFSPDGRRLATVGLHAYRKDAEWSGVRIWSLRTGRCEQFVPSSTILTSLAFSPDGRRLAIGGIEGEIELRTIGRAAATRAWTIRDSGPTVTDLVFSPDGKLLASGSDDGSVRLWTVPEGRLKQSLAFPATDVILAFSRDGRRLTAVEEPDFGMVGGGHVARRWDLATGKAQTLRVTGESELYVATSEGSAVLGQSGRTIRRWRFPR
jgi:WD40 repeat protein